MPRYRLFVAILGLVIGMVSPSRSDTITLDVTADIDGRDDLIIVSNTLQWHHFDFTPVGLHNPDYPSTILTTTLDGATDLNAYAWTPTWPDGTGYGAYSSTFSGLIPALPMENMTVVLDVEQARSMLTLVQLPSASNGYTTIVEFNDDAPASDALYEGKLTFTSSAVPEPSTFVLSFLSLGLLGGFVAARRCRSSGGFSVSRPGPNGSIRS
jgi:hypothetical protein